MASSRSASPNDGAPYWGGSDIVWPAGFTCVGRKLGSLAHGETWIIFDNAKEAIEALESKQEKIEKGLEYVEKQINEIEDRLAQRNEAEDGDLDDIQAAYNAQRADSFDPFAEEEVYGGTEDTDDEYPSASQEGDYAHPYAKSGNRSQYRRARDKLANLHNYEDPEVLLEEKNRIRLDLEDSLSEVREELEHLRKSRFHCPWGDKTIPAHLTRVDAPWLQFSAGEQKASNPSAEKASGGSGRQGLAKAKRDKKGSKADSKKKHEEVPNEEEATAAEENALPREYCVKLLSPKVSVAADGRRFFHSDALRSDASIKPLLIEGETILTQQWKVILGAGNGDPESLCLLPLIAVLEVAYSQHDCRKDVGFTSVHCKNGSIPTAVASIAGRKKDYWFDSNLILKNLKTTINTMALFQRADITHGNIKPSNVYISTDGFHLLLGDFLPPTEVEHWIMDMVKNLSNVPTYFSPELYDAVRRKKIRNYDTIKKTVNFHKHDAFCLGMTYYYIATREEPKDFFKDPKRVDRGLQQLREASVSPELLSLITRLLTYNADQRPTFWDILTFGEKASVTGQTVLSAIRGLFGLNDPAESSLTPAPRVDARKEQRSPSTKDKGQRAADGTSHRHRSEAKRLDNSAEAFLKWSVRTGEGWM